MGRYDLYSSAVRYFKKQLAGKIDLSIRRVRLPDDLDGDASLKGGRFLVRINRKLPEQAAIYVLLHEIGHCLAWDDDRHGAAWGSGYSKAYRIYLKWLGEG